MQIRLLEVSKAALSPIKQSAINNDSLHLAGRMREAISNIAKWPNCQTVFARTAFDERPNAAAFGNSTIPVSLQILCEFGKSTNKFSNLQ